MRVDRAARIFAVAIPMVLLAGLPAPAQAPSSAPAPTGAIMSLADAGQVGGKAATAPERYAARLTAADPDEGTVGTAANARTTAERIDAAPAPARADRAAGRKDATIPADIDGCRPVKAGGKPRPACEDPQAVAGTIAEVAQTFGRRQQALELYQNVLARLGTSRRR
jgi:hypothetical protein